MRAHERTDHHGDHHSEEAAMDDGGRAERGMALEPIIPNLDEGDNPKLLGFRRRF